MREINAIQGKLYKMVKFETVDQSLEAEQKTINFE